MIGLLLYSFIALHGGGWGVSGTLQGNILAYRATACPHRQSIGMVPPTTSVARHLPITVSYTSLGEERRGKSEGEESEWKSGEEEGWEKERGGLNGWQKRVIE